MNFKELIGGLHGAAVTVITMDTFKYLIQLYHDLKAQGCYIQAAKCIDAACRCTEALPASKAVACIEYSKLLVDHFDNLDLARDMLLKAVRELDNRHNVHSDLKCEAQHYLISCHRLRGDPKQALEACQAGLQAATKGAPSEVLLRWRVYFIFRTAEFMFESDGDADAALEVLGEVEKLDGLTRLEPALLAFTRAAVNLQAGRLHETNQQLNSCADILGEFPNHEGIDEDDQKIAERLRSHYFLLYAATALAVGRAAELHDEQTNEYPVFTQLQEALSGAAVYDGGWLPGPMSFLS